MREYLRGFLLNIERMNIERTHDYCCNNHDYSNVHLNSGNSKTEQPTTLTYADRGAQTSNTVATYSQQTQPEKKEGCYIATAVYGSYDAPEVMTLRRFRDETLRNSAFGRWFIRTYYRLSPPVAKRLKNARHINGFVRSTLDKWVEKLNNKRQ